MAGEAVIIGSGAAGSVVAWELARNGWSVTVLERGRHLREGLGERPSGELGTRYGSDEIKNVSRAMGFPDGLLEPYTTRTQAEAADGTARSARGALGQLGAAVGGTTLHYNAKTPRFWKQDFTQLSDHGPVEGAQVADWPIGYDDLEPYYDEVERRVGVQGDIDAMPSRTLEQSPRSAGFEMPPNPVPYVGSLLGEGARRASYTTYPQPAAVNSTGFDGRPACNSCGLCSGYGCPINARGDALVSWLNPAVGTGRVRVIDRAFVHRIDTTRKGHRARRVRYLDMSGREHAVSGDIVVVAGSPINTARLLLLSATGAHPDGLGNGSGQLGRNMMFHNLTLAVAVFGEDVHPLRSQSNALQLDDLVGPFTGPEVKALGVPYVKGAMVQVGGAMPLLESAELYAGLVGYGQAHKELMKAALTYTRIGGSAMWHEDLPQADNRVDLDPEVTDFLGIPSARITYSPHQHEKAAAMLLGPRMQAFHQLAPGAIASAFVPYPVISDGATYSAHLGGTARMGEDPATSVCDGSGRMHEVDNVYVADASTFPTFPGFNPTLTIMANALRIARGIAGGSRQGGS
ncbi:GMC family oxidoreductase [Haloechinothrix sp. YIM 98757]|uniref:GMC family oxidoreductase n=1 Tax=Haloechinothrix aidingensis TaxID=2752311 RepID=A0A838ADP2_9PSEU|nr:GMC family oxidoreductase [Haloechinothrix aidingensis]MBA0127424.1 GMC family oxidoreductase [Haloechinothrix aidingensis]